MEHIAIGEQLKNGIERVVWLPMRLRHRARARTKHKARKEALVTVQSTLQRATQLNLANLKTVFNVGMYVLLIDQDLAYFTDDLVCAIGERRRAFIAKHEAVLLYEAAEDLPQLLGRQFRTTVKAVGASEEQISRLNAVSSELSAFWQNHREFLGTIRNALAAHRDHDALRYAHGLMLLKPLEVMARAAEFSERLGRLIAVLTDLAALSARPVNILRDMVSTDKSSAD